MPTNFSPKVSIIIPVYNGSNYLKEAIDSALSQTYKNIEILVVNDGSNDRGKTEKICKSYGEKIKYFFKENGGVSSALNLAIEKMKGEYFSWLSHDDVYYPEKVEKQIEILSNLPDIDKKILFCDFEQIDEKSKSINLVKFDHEILIKKPEYALLRGCLNGITLLIPKVAFQKHGNFDEKFRCTQDYDMWRRLSKSYLFHHCPFILTKTRVHGKQDSKKHPKVFSENDLLWINMIKDVSKEKKAELEGSEYNFYIKMYEFVDNVLLSRNVCNFITKEMEKISSNALEEIKKIKVTVVIPFFNRLDPLYKSLDSVAKQTHKNLEIILINDGSKENIGELKKRIKKDSRIKLMELSTNKGPAAARNVGMDAATGEYIAFLDSDDFFVPSKIEKQLHQMFLTQSNISHTSYTRRNNNEDTVIHIGKRTGKVLAETIKSCQIATPTVMLKTEYLRKNKLRYREDFRIGEDVCFWLSILKNTELLGIDEPYTIVNVNENSSYRDTGRHLLGLTNILEFILSDKDLRTYHKEISILCKYFTDLSRVLELSEKNKKRSFFSSSTFTRKGEVKYWSFKNPFSIISRLIYLFKHQGVGVTFKKAAKKYFGRQGDF